MIPQVTALNSEQSDLCSNSQSVCVCACVLSQTGARQKLHFLFLFFIDWYFSRIFFLICVLKAYLCKDAACPFKIAGAAHTVDDLKCRHSARRVRFFPLVLIECRVVSLGHSSTQSAAHRTKEERTDRIKPSMGRSRVAGIPSRGERNHCWGRHQNRHAALPIPTPEGAAGGLERCTPAGHAAVGRH